MIHFRKLYSNKPPDGVNAFAIVTYRRWPYYQENYKITQYEKRLMIDCWLFMLTMTWKTRRK